MENSKSCRESDIFCGALTGALLTGLLMDLLAGASTGTVSIFGSCLVPPGCRGAGFAASLLSSFRLVPLSGIWLVPYTCLHGHWLLDVPSQRPFPVWGGVLFCLRR